MLPFPLTMPVCGLLLTLPCLCPCLSTLIPSLVVAFIWLVPPAVMCSPSRVQRRLRHSLGARGARRSLRDPQPKLNSFLCLPLCSPTFCLFLKFGNNSSLAFACSAVKTMRHALRLSEKDFQRNFVIFKFQDRAKTHRSNVASVCETVSSHEDIELSFIDTSEQRGEPLTKALTVQKWSHVLDLLSISTQRLPDFPVSE